MRAAAICGLGSSPRDLRPFQQNSTVDWVVGLPASAEGLDAILVFGGDGTLHRHLHSLVKLGLPLLVIPAGSGNDFARALGIRRERDSRRAWQRFAASAGNVRTTDLGVITPLSPDTSVSAPPGGAAGPRFFSCAGGVGLDGEISRRANALPRWLRGHGGYALSLPPALLGFRPFAMRLSAAQDPSGAFAAHSARQVVAAIFANTPVYGGGMRIAPKAAMDDGLLDACLIGNVSKLKLVTVFPSVYLGRHLGIREVEYFATARARVETEVPMDVYADGEYTCRTPVEFGVARGVLRVIVP
jgi:diacylglycerol kinase (ATP)